jgi:hypothetical protein
MHELAAERAAKLVVGEAEKRAKERLLMEIERSAEHRNRIEEKRLLDISREEKICAIRERWAWPKIAADNRRLRRDLEETTKQQNHTSELKPTSIADQKKQNATWESWAKLKAEAEGRRHISNETKRQPCSHLALGLLKWKGKGRCSTCEITFTKHLFKMC